MVQLVQVPQQQFFDQDAEQADHQRGEDQHDPVIEPQIGQAHPGHEGAQHVQGAVGEVDDVQQTENHGQPQREHGIERAVDQPQQQLPQQCLNGYAE
ncbi:Uncharacterised protein [Bordetella pertussis]|nr:Uncharacterised protein [Bordetella pertussis]